MNTEGSQISTVDVNRRVQNMAKEKRDTEEFFPAKRRGKLTPGEAVSMLRELHEMTQNQLAEASGVPQPVISAIEHGRASLGIDRAKKLARALKVHPAVLAFADWEEERPARPAKVRVRAAS